MDLALGLIETRGLVGAIEAADAMVKAADVKIISKEKVTGALIIIKVMGETAAVKSSVDAGAAAAQRVGELLGAHVIPRPDDQIDQLLFDKTEAKGKAKSKKTVTKKESIPSDAPQSKTKIVSKSKSSELVKKIDSQKIEPAAKPKTSDAISDKKVDTKETKVPQMEQLVILNVHALRRIARGIENFPIKGREISKANRAKLLDYFKKLQ